MTFQVSVAPAVVASETPSSWMCDRGNLIVITRSVSERNFRYYPSSYED